MRPIETLLLLANLLTFFILAVPWLCAVRWKGYSAPIALLIAVAQVLVEGPRWQMVPAYALTGLFLLVWLLQNSAQAGRTEGKKCTNRLAFGLGVLGLVVSIVLPMVLPVFHFPHPSGPYEIGTLTYHWVDANRPEVFSADPNARRKLMVQIWYPARGDSSSPRAPYMQDADVVASELARLQHFPEFTFRQLKYVTTNAIPSAPMSDDKPNYPVLIFLEGLTGFRQMNTFQVEELVSHGYIVAAIDQPYAAASVVFPDGRQVGGLSKDQMNVLIQQSVSPVERAPILNGRTLKDGIVVGEACRLEPRLRACLVMDAPMPADVVQSGLQQPSMWITRDAETIRLERQRAGGWSEADINQHQTTMLAVFEKSLPGDGYFVRVPGMFHANLMDFPYWSPLFSRLGVTGPIDGQRAHNIINAYSLAFFEWHLKGRPAAQLDGPAEQYPEVLFETRRL